MWWECLFLFLNPFLSSIKNLKINQEKKTLKTEIFGDKAENYKIHIDVKAITYNSMFVKKIKNKWIAQAVLDV